MDRSQERGLSVGLLAGRLEGAALPDLLWALNRARKTGLIHFEHKQVRKTVYLKEGKIVFAASNLPNDRLGEQLLRHGRVTLAQLEQAIGQIHTGKRIGTLLVESGGLSPEHLVDGVLSQVKKIVHGLFDWEEGEYHFEEGPLPTDEVITINMSTGELLLSGIRGIRSFARIRRSVGTPRTMYRLCDDWREALDSVRLSEGEELLVVRLEQGDESVEGLCREVFLSNFEIYQTLWGLKILGVVEEKMSLAESGDAEWQGSLAETHFANVLIEVAHRRETGILHVIRRMRERTFHFHEGRCVFATSNDADDGLIAYLLRRGVISLSDREETAKRMLSNKRVGTILRELGVIDDRDLEEMVRQQLSEVVYDTFRWDEGDFAFYAGDLPSIEEITLATSMESLVAEGIRRVDAWPRVKEGCGGMDDHLSLSESYLDVLDGLDAGAEEWQVVNVLKEPLPASEIAASVELPDFRVCQILWTLRVLKAIEISPPEARVVQEREPAESIPVDIVDLDRPAVIEEPAEEPVDVHVSYSDDDATVEDDAESAVEPEPFAVHAADDATVEDDVESAVAPEPVEEDEPVEAAAGQYAETIEIETGSDEEPATEIPVHEEPAEPVEFDEDHVDSLRDEPLRVTLDETAAADDEEIEIDVVDPDSEPAYSAVEETAQDEAIEDPHLRALEESTRTMRLSREEVDAALESPPEEAHAEEAPAEEAPAEEAPVEERELWEPPADLDQSILRFNAMQRLIYRSVRSEVGAGAANFIRACGSETAPNPIEDTTLQSDGTWDSEGLRRQVLENRIEDPWESYRQLIDRELEVLRTHVGAAKIVELQRQVEQVSENHGQTARPPE